MEFLMYIVISLIISIAMKPKIESMKPPSQDDLEFPTVDEKRNISVPFGQVRIKSISHIWAANNVIFEEMTKNVGGFLGDEVPTGYKTIMSNAVLLGFGQCRLKKIFFNDVEVYASSNPLGDETTFLDIEAKDIFKKEGDQASDNGVSGNLMFYDGTQTTQDPHIIEQQGQDELPPFKGLSYIMFEEFYFGNSRTLSTPDIEVIRSPLQILGNNPLILNNYGDYDANPINILYDIMIESEMYGVGIPFDDIDHDSFLATANKLEEEGFGLSLIFESGANFDDIKKDIQKHISANLFLSPYTGKWTITLNRNDYVKEDLEIFDKSKIKSIKYSRAQSEDLYTEFKCNFTDRQQNYKDRQLLAKSASTLNIRGRANSQTDDFYACKSDILASKIAQRELLGYSKPISRIELVTNRAAFGYEIGEVIKVTYEDYGIEEGIYRITEIDLGEYNNNEIKINLIEDVFSFGDAAIGDLSGTKWSRPRSEDYDFEYLIEEAPIFFGNENNLLTSIGNHSSRSKGYKVYSDEINSPKILQKEAESTCPYAYLYNRPSRLEDKLIIYTPIPDSTANKRDYNINFLKTASISGRKGGQNLVVLYSVSTNTSEYISFSSINKLTDETYELTNCWRGCLDTTPKDWVLFETKDVVMFFVSYSNLVTNLDITNTLGAKAIFDVDRTFSDSSDLLLVNDKEIEFSNRHEKPIYPYAVKVNGEVLSETIPLFTDLQLSWGGSNRLAQVLNVGYFTENIYTSEDGLLFNIEIYYVDAQENLVFLRSVETSDLSYNYTEEKNDSGVDGYYDNLVIKMKTVRDLIESKETLSINISRVDKTVDINYINFTTLPVDISKIVSVGLGNSLIISRDGSNIKIYRNTNGLTDLTIDTTVTDNIISTQGSFIIPLYTCISENYVKFLYSSNNGSGKIIYFIATLSKSGVIQDILQIVNNKGETNESPLISSSSFLINIFSTNFSSDIYIQPIYDENNQIIVDESIYIVESDDIVFGYILEDKIRIKIIKNDGSIIEYDKLTGIQPIDVSLINNIRGSYKSNSNGIANMRNNKFYFQNEDADSNKISFYELNLYNGLIIFVKDYKRQVDDIFMRPDFFNFSFSDKGEFSAIIGTKKISSLSKVVVRYLIGSSIQTSSEYYYEFNTDVSKITSNLSFCDINFIDSFSTALIFSGSGSVYFSKSINAFELKAELTSSNIQKDFISSNQGTFTCIGNKSRTTYFYNFTRTSWS